MATHMERISIAPHIIAVCLGHTLKGIGATYRHYSYLPEKAAALQARADELSPEAKIDVLGNSGRNESASEGLPNSMAA